MCKNQLRKARILHPENPFAAVYELVQELDLEVEDVAHTPSTLIKHCGREYSHNHTTHHKTVVGVNQKRAPRKNDATTTGLSPALRIPQR